MELSNWFEKSKNISSKDFLAVTRFREACYGFFKSLKTFSKYDIGLMSVMMVLGMTQLPGNLLSPAMC